MQGLCGRYKPLSEFYEHPMLADGHLNSCNECTKAYQRSRPYDKDHERQRNQTFQRRTVFGVTPSNFATSPILNRSRNAQTSVV
jgi:hypothetical protein